MGIDFLLTSNVLKSLHVLKNLSILAISTIKHLNQPCKRVTVSVLETLMAYAKWKSLNANSFLTQAL